MWLMRNLPRGSVKERSPAVAALKNVRQMSASILRSQDSSLYRNVSLRLILVVVRRVVELGYSGSPMENEIHGDVVGTIGSDRDYP